MIGSRYDVIILGSGLSGLCAAMRILELEKANILVLSPGSGATPYIAAINVALPYNPWGDSVKQHYLDTMEAGFWINDPMLVEEMCFSAPRCIELLQEWGVRFASKDGDFLRRRTSGSSYPRSLCQTSGLIGGQISSLLREVLLRKGVKFVRGFCNNLIVYDGRVYGVSFVTHDESDSKNIFAPVVVAAWGGIGTLFPDSTYPSDVDGRGLAIAFEAGVSLIDLEFLEFEPLVLLHPPSLRGEPCPTAMLGEGAYLLNKNGERFLLRFRPQGEAGAPKSLINMAIWDEVSRGNGSPHGGIYVDLRHIPESTLRAYPWFYNRVVSVGLDPKRDLLEVGPMAHSHSGGIKVERGYRTSVKGFFAIGEAAGGIHGACRLGGNAATQALVSGILAAEEIAKEREENEREFEKALGKKSLIDSSIRFKRNASIMGEKICLIKDILRKAFGFRRSGCELERAFNLISDILESTELKLDTFSYQTVLSALLLIKAAFLREETRGSHYREDYPFIKPQWQCSIEIFKGEDGSVCWRKVSRSPTEEGFKSCF
ncbi:MAG: FAD-binding protein [Synergistetes bacterium]|nr:FAD-binding protein [Synergistota bacterium]MDW8192620.1 FAD-binding protein [Synergistota bacterium]